MLLRTAKSCGPDAPTLASSSRSGVGPTGLRQDISAGDGGKRARSPGRARRKPLKPLRAGTSGDSGVLVYSCAFLPMQSAHEAAGATGTRRSPRPLFQGRNVSGKIPGVPRRKETRRSRLLTFQKNEAGSGYSLSEQNLEFPRRGSNGSAW